MFNKLLRFKQLIQIQWKALIKFSAGNKDGIVVSPFKSIDLYEKAFNLIKFCQLSKRIPSPAEIMFFWVYRSLKIRRGFNKFDLGSIESEVEIKLIKLIVRTRLIRSTK